MDIHKASVILHDVKYPEYGILANTDGRGEMFLQATYNEADIHTGQVEVQFTRRWFISPAMSASELVQTALKMILTSLEHRAREHFKYKGELVFGPHFDVDDLVALAATQRRAMREA